MLLNVVKPTYIVWCSCCYCDKQTLVHVLNVSFRQGVIDIAQLLQLLQTVMTFGLQAVGSAVIHAD